MARASRHWIAYLGLVLNFDGVRSIVYVLFIVLRCSAAHLPCSQWYLRVQGRDGSVWDAHWTTSGAHVPSQLWGSLHFKITAASCCVSRPCVCVFEVSIAVPDDIILDYWEWSNWPLKNYDNYYALHVHVVYHRNFTTIVIGSFCHAKLKQNTRAL